MEKNEEKIREIEVGMIEKNSEKEWELMVTKLLLQQMKEERARGDEVVRVTGRQSLWKVSPGDAERLPGFEVGDWVRSKPSLGTRPSYGLL
ncbi:hypothetical protein RJT34_02650 [Clitoria ternatea]|uniref:Uncharacterized protein n=1 Tax=Clitoria ternatea TaxID=43366 RepID=A0AAN9Q0G7_CLITE